MAASLDPGDDPNKEVRRYVDVAIGGRLYVIDHLLRNDARGGLSPEGWQYGPGSLGYLAQTLLALHTAGLDDPNRSSPLFSGSSPQVEWAGHPFWDDVAPAFLHSLSPATAENPWYGDVYQPSWFGDGQDYYVPDFIRLFGPLGLFDYYTNPSSERLASIRWLQRNVPVGGADGFEERINSPSEFFTNSILYFLLYDPNAESAKDPRSSWPTDYFAEGTGHLYSRTGWSAEDALFTFDVSWNSIDHQLEEGGQFGFYRGEEWLTRGMVAWDGTVEPYGCNSGRSEFKNSLTIEQGEFPPGTDPPEFIELCRLEGSQADTAPSDPRWLARGFNSSYSYATVDLAPLYDISAIDNGEEPGPDNVLHCSRSIFWLKPDRIVVYDRITTREPGFRRFWLNASTMPALSAGSENAYPTARVQTAKGQRLDVTVVKPERADVTAREIPERILQEQANWEDMDFQIKIEAPPVAEIGPGGWETRFLVVLEGTNESEFESTIEGLESASGDAMTGVWIDGRTAILFPHDVGDGANPAASFAIQFQERPETVFVTGLEASGRYGTEWTETNEGWRMALAPGGSLQADAGGILQISSELESNRPRLAIQRMPNAQVKLIVDEGAGQAWAIQVSTDLGAWAELAQGVGDFEFEENIQPALQANYYRAVRR